MQLIFLSEQDLSVLDYGYATDEYEIVLDALIPQKSSFVVNKQSLKAGIGDLLIVKEKAIHMLESSPQLKKTIKKEQR